MSLVCQTSALPDQFVAPFTLGAPRDANPADVYIAAEMKVANGQPPYQWANLLLQAQYRAGFAAGSCHLPPHQRQICEVNGQERHDRHVPQCRRHEVHQTYATKQRAQALLAGINSAIDMDNIIKGVNGDMTIIAPSLGSDNFQMTMAAQLKNADWLGDVDYWKQSVPQGGHIGDWGRDCYYYTDSKTTYFFGVTQDWQYMSGRL